jgi:predicted TPR repeat methyltransferase
MFLPDRVAHFSSALDICCGEGWITKDLPADEIHGLEISDNAAARFPENVKRIFAPEQKYDFIMATGCLYAHYDWKQIVGHINNGLKKDTVIMISNIATWEHPPAVREIKANQIYTAKFNYNEHQQQVRVFLA